MNDSDSLLAWSVIRSLNERLKSETDKDDWIFVDSLELNGLAPHNPHSLTFYFYHWTGGTRHIVGGNAGYHYPKADNNFKGFTLKIIDHRIDDLDETAKQNLELYLDRTWNHIRSELSQVIDDNFDEKDEEEWDDENYAPNCQEYGNHTFDFEEVYGNKPDWLRKWIKEANERNLIYDTDSNFFTYRGFSISVSDCADEGRRFHVNKIDDHKVAYGGDAGGSYPLAAAIYWIDCRLDKI